MGEINITYETLFELLRREKNREELQKLDITFFSDVANYLKEKKEFLEQQRTKEDLFAAEEIKKAEIQEQNIRKILRELYERREKKIINMAIDRSRTSASIVDTAALLKEEKEMYEYLVDTLDRFRKGVLFSLLEAENPKLESKNIVKIDVEEKKEESDKPRKVKFVHDVPKFIGENLEEYGPFEAAEAAELPKKIADVLVDKGRAEEI